MKTEKILNTLWTISVLSFLLYIILNNILNNNELKETHFFTIGVASDTYKGSKFPDPFVEFKYSIYGKRYKNSHGYNSKLYKVEIGKKYLIMFSPKDPSNSAILLKFLVPDDFVYPENGWSQAPVEIFGPIDYEF